MTKPSTFSRLWPGLTILVFVLDAALFFLARPLHRSLFEGELGLVEMLTWPLLLLAVPIAIWGASRAKGANRVLLILLALGCFYWGMEEISWGQTFFHWATPENWSKGNYQQEMNLHNERGIVGTLLNQTPRLILLILTILSMALRFVPFPGFRRVLLRTFPADWVDRLAQCWLPATLAVAATLLNKLKPWTGYKGFGESLELFTAVFLLQFVVLQAGAARASAAPSLKPE